MSKFRDIKGSFLTQGLFLELEYNESHAVYTLKEEDWEYKGKTYPSIRRLYLECEDITEYEFANKYFGGWSHWKRLQGNKRILREIDEWREELEVKIRAQAIRSIVDQTASESQGSFQAAKWLADKGWDKARVGRPSKSDKEKDDKIAEKLADEFAGDVARLRSIK